ncbi:helix-turn-helix domain-containing protein [Martelella alba]|uniref:Helix-turn-helix transcriptional regulator n=1 Tax=Martelella alba TaxID=2590451 RepID=A0ABY2SD29_9HYPH|nr:helix-turn-helix transcriptional regulator [Martelella alba]TKI01737.1 helix-turn-helix transcriptional regulator [Martelella alba]
MIAYRLKRSRLDAGLSQKELGMAAGIEPETAKQRISQYENGRASPPFPLAIRLAAVLDVPECYFYIVSDDFAHEVVKLYKEETNLKSR